MTTQTVKLSAAKTAKPGAAFVYQGNHSNMAGKTLTLISRDGNYFRCQTAQGQIITLTDQDLITEAI